MISVSLEQGWRNNLKYEESIVDKSLNDILINVSQKIFTKKNVLICTKF